MYCLNTATASLARFECPHCKTDIRFNSDNLSNAWIPPDGHLKVYNDDLLFSKLVIFSFVAALHILTLHSHKRCSLSLWAII